MNWLVVYELNMLLFVSCNWKSYLPWSFIILTIGVVSLTKSVSFSHEISVFKISSIILQSLFSSVTNAKVFPTSTKGWLNKSMFDSISVPLKLYLSSFSRREPPLAREPSIVINIKDGIKK